MLKSGNPSWIGITLLAWAGAAPAQTPLDRETALTALLSVFDRMDCDHNGLIDPGEIDEHFSQVWSPADLDRSRSLSASEFARTHRPLPGPAADALFRAADRDADGRVDADELRAHLRELILRFDGNGDWEVSRADLRPEPGS